MFGDSHTPCANSTGSVATQSGRGPPHPDGTNPNGGSTSLTFSRGTLLHLPYLDSLSRLQNLSPISVSRRGPSDRRTGTGPRRAMLLYLAPSEVRYTLYPSLPISPLGIVRGLSAAHPPSGWGLLPGLQDASGT